MNTNTPQKPLKESLFEKIETDKVYPKSKLFYRSRECIVWSLWSLSVVSGAFAVAVSLFVVTHQQYAFYEATHDNLFTFLVDALPYLWIIFFGLMVYVAMYNIRHTARGYRYSLSAVLFSSLSLSVLGGFALQYFGLGYTVDDILGQNMSIYMSREKTENHMWQNPEEGRLLGKQLYGTLSPTTTIIFEDSSGKRWTMNVSELKDKELQLLISERRVKLLGKEVDPKLHIFHACGAFPWMMEKGLSRDDMSSERLVFLDRIQEHANNVDTVIFSENDTSFASTSLSKKSICHTIAPVQRMTINKKYPQ